MCFAFGTPAAHLSGRKHFPITKKDPQVYRLQVLSLGAPSAGAFKKQCSALFLATESRGLTNTALWCWLPPAGGRPVLVHGASQKRAPDPKIGGFFWCTISESVQKTVQCTVFSDRSPRGECKPHRGAARARPVGDGAPCASLSITHNAKKDPQTKPFAGLITWCTIGDSNPGPTD